MKEEKQWSPVEEAQEMIVELYEKQPDLLWQVRPEIAAVMGVTNKTRSEKQIAKELQEKDKLRAILEMAGAVSHELNNPLTVVLLGIEKLEDTKLGQSQKQELIQLVKKSTLRLIELSSKIRSISRYAAKDYVEGKKIFDIDAGAGE